VWPEPWIPPGRSKEEWFRAIKGPEPPPADFWATRAERREQWLEEIAQEDFDSTINTLLHVLELFDIDPNAVNRRWDDHAGLLDIALAKPRIQKIMQVAEQGSEAERLALARKIASACEEFLATTPLVAELSSEQSLAGPYGVQYLALTLPALEDGTEHFELVAYMHYLHQKALQTRRPRESARHIFGDNDSVLAHASNQYLHRIAASEVEQTHYNAEQWTVIEDYRALLATHDLDEQVRDLILQPSVLEFTVRFWGHELQGD